MNYRDILKKASDELLNLKEEKIEVLTITKPPDTQYAKNLMKVISKISPLVGNMIEFFVVNILNRLDWSGFGKWKRQDPDFPDTVFESSLKPQPGIEIKTWFPFATEITARFKDSILYFEHDQTYVAIIVWLPEFILYGVPKVIDVWVGSGKSLAIARDKHYHRPPSYLVFEPEDTSSRTRNLQQTNTNGYKFQGSAENLKEAEDVMKSWGKDYFIYKPTKEYQDKMKSLLGKYSYRLDTNFAKIDRIEHNDLEKFKKKVLNKKIEGFTIREWSNYVCSDDAKINLLLEKK